MSKFYKAALGAYLAAGIVISASAWSAPNHNDSEAYGPAPKGQVKSYNFENKNEDSDKDKNLKGKSVQALADARLASLWFAEAYDIPPRVTEEMFIAGYTYADAVVALSLMNQGASLNEALELRRVHRWDEVAKALNIDPETLPKPVRELLSGQRVNRDKEYVHFMPDVRPGLRSAAKLPSFSPVLPDSVCIVRHRMSGEEVRNVREALENTNNLTVEMLNKPAGRTLKVADWIIAGTLAKYKPFSVTTFLEVRVGEVVEWSDVASMFSVDPQIFVDGPLAPIYASMIRGENYATIPTLMRSSYPDSLDRRWEFDSLDGAELQALGWLMSLYYKETDMERELLNETGLTFIDQALSLAAARMAFVDVEDVVKMAARNLEWSQIFAHYNIDLTGQDVVWQAALGRDQGRRAEREAFIEQMRQREKAARRAGKS
ncbi:hypothetical protein IJT93_12235 [bacterium]|nr:hypothetical protein [bacterium]